MPRVMLGIGGRAAEGIPLTISVAMDVAKDEGWKNG